MRLISLNLQNFRQHKATEIEFPAGLTGILGTNGAGKSTILEAIAWAIYGNQAGVTRGDAESIIWRLAPGKSSAMVELTFAFNGQTFTVRRSQSASKSNAEFQQEGRVVATSTKAVNERLNQLLGMSHTEFFNSYFTGQKDLNFLGTIKGAAERERFIAKMLGYERITEAQGAAGKAGTLRDDRREQEKIVLKLEGSLGSWEQIQLNLTTCQSQVQQAERQLKEATAALESAIHKQQALEPQLILLEQQRDTFNQLERDRQVLQSSQEQIAQQITELTVQRNQLSAMAADAEALQLEVASYNDLLAQYQELTKLEQASRRRTELETTLQQRQLELQAAQQQLVALQDSQAALQATQSTIAQYQQQIQDLTTAIATETQTWQVAQAELKAKIASERQNLQKLETQKHTIVTAGASGICPTCERPLEAEYDTVTGRFSAQILHLQAHLEEWQTELQALNAPPVRLGELQANQATINKELQTVQQQATQYATAVTKQELIQQNCDRYQTEIERLTTEISDLPADFDREFYAQLAQQLTLLKPKYERYLRTADAPQRLAQIDQQIAQLLVKQTEITTNIQKIIAKIAELDFNETNYRALKEAIAAATQQVNSAKNIQNTAERTVALNHQALQVAQDAVADYQRKEKAYQTAKRELALLDELDRAYTSMRQHFTEQIRPQLADIASLFLTQLTDGRYTSLEIDNKYNVVVWDDGDRKPVISGGEEDIVNLCLRLAISQMIAERSGMPFSLLVLDEVFGSLDDGRRNNVISLLHSLERQFDQVLIITHIESLKESLNHSIRLEFDPQEKCSRRLP